MIDFDYHKLKGLDINKKNELALLIRNEIINDVNINGGHLSSNLGVVELTISLLSIFDPSNDNFIFDVGHQSYAFKLLTGRSLDNLRHINGEKPFISYKDSIYDKSSTGHSGTAIGISSGLSYSNNDNFTLAIVGDSSFANGVSLESLKYISDYQDKFKKLIIIENINGMSISINNDKNSDIVRKKIDFFKSINHSSEFNLKGDNKMVTTSTDLINEINIIDNIDGHNISQMIDCFNYIIKNTSCCPIIIRIYTQKGQGLKEAEIDTIGSYHNIDVSKEKFNLIESKNKIINDKLKSDNNVYFVNPSTKHSLKLDKVFADNSNKVIDCGIAEETSVLFTSGLATRKKHVILDIYSTFLQRGIDEIIENILKDNIPVLTIIERASLAYEDGSTHHGIYDVQLLSNLPNMLLYQPFDVSSMKHLIYENTFDKPTFIRIPKFAMCDDSKIKEFNSVVFLNKCNSSCLYLSTGFRGYEILQKLDSSIDKAIIFQLNKFKIDNLNKYNEIKFFDYYSTIEGVTKNLKAYLFENNYSGKFTYKALPNEFIPHGTYQELNSLLHMNDEDVLDFYKRC